MPVLRLENVSKKFGGYRVLNGVELKVIEKEKHALIGPNGAGKTTIFNLITGQFSASRGAIYFKDKRIDGLPPYKVNRLGIARSFQIINIFKEMTVYENVRNAIIAKKRISLKFTRKVASLVDVREETDCLLKRINLGSFRNEPAGTLGYGQQRALEIGLTIALDPEVVLLDEPGAGLTLDETKGIISLIREVTADKTLLIVEHDMDIVFKLADRISVLNRGMVVVTGTPDEIKKNEMVKETYLGNISDEICAGNG